MQLIADKLSLYRGNRLILNDISFTLAAGEALVLTGPNGAGKTTLIRAIAGFLPLASGSITLAGGAEDHDIGEQSHFVGHRDGIKGALTVEENAAFFAQYLGFSSPLVGEVARRAGGGGSASPQTAQDHNRSSVHATLEHLGLAALADVPAAWLSAGQRRRLGLSRLLLAKRPLWLLDEPTVSLDAAAVETLARMIADHLSSGGMAIAATHIPLGLSTPRELRLGGGRAIDPTAQVVA
jgi:heme exporter protein A